MNVSYYYNRPSQSSIDEEEWLTADRMAVSITVIYKYLRVVLPLLYISSLVGLLLSIVP